jgi:hypothetical protein
MIADIYAHIPLLEDVQFLINYAPTIFPDSPALATGEVVAGNMLALQQDLIRQRQVRVTGGKALNSRKACQHVTFDLGTCAGGLVV